ncbi:zinc finger FYVE domain-containing protein 26, partial [Trichonephila clavata]
NCKPEWEKYAPPLEPRTLFVLLEGLLYSPKLQILLEKKQRSLTLIFNAPVLSCGIILSYADSNTLTLENNSGKAAPVLDTQPCVLNYLKDKCSILNDLYEIFRSKLVSECMSIENLCLEASVQTLFLSEESENQNPVTLLLSYYKKMLISTKDEYSWFSSALSPSPDKGFLSEQIRICFSKNEWHQHLASANKLMSSMDPCNYALCIRDPVYRANIILQNVYKWEDHPAVQALKFCLSDHQITNYPAIHKGLERKLKEVLLYKKIFDASEMFGDSDAKDCVYVFNNWQEVADCSVWDQSRILDFIKSSGKYNLAVQWSELHIINSEQKMLALSMNIIWYLTQDPPQEQAVFEIIDSFEDPSECMVLCDMVLPELPTIESKLYLVQYLVDNNVSPEKQFHYFNMALGLKMLSALKSPNKELYSDLAAHPYILLEQMLMNVELKDAELALKAIYQDLKEENHGMAPVLTLSSVNQLVEDYASKALEVHFLDSLLDVSSSSTLVLSTEEILVSDEPFMMPLRVPTKDEWVPDAKIERCQVCREERFNMNDWKLSLTTASFEKRYRVFILNPRNSPYQTDNLGLRRRSSSIQINQQAFRWVLSADSEQNASVRNDFLMNK